jgi:hypothetical protein
MSSADRSVVFACLHGAGKSRIAAAIFNQIAPPGWRALSAGLEPDKVLSQTASRLLAGTEAASHLDQEPPRSVDAAGQFARMVGIDCHPTGATDHWTLQHQEFDQAMRDEIRLLTERYASELSSE